MGLRGVWGVKRWGMGDRGGYGELKGRVWGVRGGVWGVKGWGMGR